LLRELPGVSANQLPRLGPLLLASPAVLPPLDSAGTSGWAPPDLRNLSEREHGASIRLVQTFLNGLRDVRTHEQDALRRDLATLARVAPPRSDSALALARVVRLADATEHGEWKRAVDLFDANSASPLWYAARPLERYWHGLALANDNRNAEAIRWLGAYAFLSMEAMTLAAPAHYRRGQLLEASGDTVRAIADYKSVTELWADCDPALRPMVENAKARLTSLRH
jgi:hypothetical protein